MKLEIKVNLFIQNAKLNTKIKDHDKRELQYKSYTKRNSIYIKESWNKVKPKEIVKTNLKQRKIISVKVNNCQKLKKKKKNENIFFKRTQSVIIKTSKKTQLFKT